ncbi:MAG: hypothetical protein AAGA57_07660, partial [Planctomycetota bacterium]
DTTIVSSFASGCEPLDHVKTQLPYALLACVISLIASAGGVAAAGVGAAAAGGASVGSYVCCVSGVAEALAVGGCAWSSSLLISIS